MGEGTEKAAFEEEHDCGDCGEDLCERSDVPDCTGRGGKVGFAARITGQVVTCVNVSTTSTNE